MKASEETAKQFCEEISVYGYFVQWTAIMSGDGVREYTMTVSGSNKVDLDILAKVAGGLKLI